MLYHICASKDWEQAQAQGEYRAASLASEGFIHCSTAGQVAGTEARFFAEQTGLVLLCIDRARVTAPVRDDDIGGGQAFPHIYGPLNLKAVVSAQDFAPDAEAQFSLE